MNARPRSRRRLAVLAVVAAVGVTITAVIAGTASAAGTGTCTSAVNVREEPSTDSRIVGVCERGHSTEVGEKRNGFVKLDEFDGWASSQYVSTGTEGSEGSTAPNRAGDGESRDASENPLLSPESNSPESESGTGSSDSNRESGSNTDSGTDTTSPRSDTEPSSSAHGVYPERPRPMESSSSSNN